MNKKLAFVLSGMILTANAEVNTIVEFFSFKCKHCFNVEHQLKDYIKKHSIKYLEVNIDNDDNALPTNIAYYVAIDSGVGEQFKRLYFAAVNSGMPVYTKSILDYVIAQIDNKQFKDNLHSKLEKEKIKKKLHYANGLLEQHNVQSTPSFLINQTTLLEGEDIIQSLENGDLNEK